GAILQNLERDDYMPLPHLQPENGAYTLRITNELKEEQFSNLARLVVVDHPLNPSVLPDQKGQPQLLQDLQQPVHALSAGGRDVKNHLLHTDKDFYFFDEPESDQNGVQLRFEKPEAATKGKLVINAGNSVWFDWLFGEFTKKFGGAYDQWIEKQAALTGEE